MVSKLEQHIVSLLNDGDKRAIPLIYENYSDALYGVILKVTINEALAEDALQETFIKVWRYAQKYDAKKAKLLELWFVSHIGKLLLRKKINY